MANSKIEEAAGALLRAWGTGPQPKGNCAGVINELRRAYEAEVVAREAARMEAYRQRARELTVCFHYSQAYDGERYEVAADATVECATVAGDSGAWVAMRVFIKDIDDQADSASRRN